jgi:hypothetical protein
MSERDLLLQQAFADSASNLSIDERYILRRLASVVAQDLPTATKYADVLISLPVAEFATHTGLTRKVAYRRLDVATHSLFNRQVRFVSDETETSIAWAGSRRQAHDFSGLTFTGCFIQHLLPVMRRGGREEVHGFVEFAGAVTAPAVLCRGKRSPAWTSCSADQSPQGT